MFTGIIEETGKILTVTSSSILIEAERVLENTKTGDSIAVNGVCLTVTDIKNNCFKADISPETYKVTALSMLKTGSIVNLERAMPANGRFGGHIVQGHIDSTAKVKSLKREGDFYRLQIELDNSVLRYAVKKGSITINGISLTVADIISNTVIIAVIPHTYENTSLKTLNVGDLVNIETDILAKYVENFLSTVDNKTGISMEFLQENGF